MNVLDSPLEALVFPYVSFGFFIFVNNLWTWVAVVTAAVSVWKIRATAGDGPGGVCSVDSSPSCDDRCSITPAPPPSVSVSVSAASVSASGHVEDNGADVLTKGRKFSLYYEHDGELTEEFEENDGAAEAVVVEEYCGGGDGDWWEIMLEMRLGEKSWYRYQELTELNGNVVRFWDDCRSSSLVWKTSTAPYY
ncbi:uncharacterized protein LOC133797342 [Humulus lupulus]|uniref:uncharacterized protein LOC133797342 n=1 Tax=Humulus lupulus TaxID=3486 RepID=UPI002B405A7F|nr:uncharacterized protein LOC133797342 [Humulus lupulus]